MKLVSMSPSSSANAAVENASIHIGTVLHRVSPGSLQFTWDNHHFHFDLTMRHIAPICEYIRQRSGGKIRVMDIDLRRGIATLSDMPAHRMVKTGTREVDFKDLPQGPQETAPALGRPTGKVLVDTYEMTDAPSDFGLNEACQELINALYATCRENQAQDLGYFESFKVKTA